MKTWSTPGGIHPADNKLQSLRNPIQHASLAKEMIFPLNQHIGTPAQVEVEVGQQVLKYQLIAQAKGPVSAPVHASTSGRISAIEQRPIAHPSGLDSLCIVLQPDGEDKAIALQGSNDFTALQPSILVDKIKAAGIAGMGGAGFPTAVKLATTKTIDTLLINAAECEPYISADDSLIRAKSKQIIQGIQVLQHIIKPTNATLIGIEDNKPQAIQALRDACHGTAIEVVVFPSKYPSGGEKQLIYILTGKEVPNGKLPADIGVLCQNIGTCFAIKEAIIDGRPLVSRITTVSGETLQPQNYEVAIGTPINHLLELSQFKPQTQQRVIMGGPMMGFAVHSLEVPIVKTSNCILAPNLRELPPNPIPQACIRCGLCAQACPVSLLPQQLYWFARSQNHEALEQHHIFDCIECGACSYSCPSHIPLVQYYRNAKAAIRNEQADKIQAEKAKVRFEQRQTRIAKEQAAKEAKREARKKAAIAAQQASAQSHASDDKQDIIAAAIARTKNKKAQSTNTRASASSEQTQDQQSQLEQQIATLSRRIENAQKKLQSLASTAPEKHRQLEQRILDQEQKLAQAKQRLTTLQDPKTSASIDTHDPAEDVIARAKRIRAQQPSEPSQQRQQSKEKLEKRILAQQQKYNQLLSEDPEKAALVKASIEKLKQKRHQLNDD